MYSIRPAGLLCSARLTMLETLRATILRMPADQLGIASHPHVTWHPLVVKGVGCDNLHVKLQDITL